MLMICFACFLFAHGNDGVELNGSNSPRNSCFAKHYYPEEDKVPSFSLKSPKSCCCCRHCCFVIVVQQQQHEALWRGKLYRESVEKLLWSKQSVHGSYWSDNTTTVVRIFPAHKHRFLWLILNLDFFGIKSHVPQINFPLPSDKNRNLGSLNSDFS